MDRNSATDLVAKLPETDPLAWMVRVGYVARGLVFLIIGGLALLAANGSGGRPQGIRDALETLFHRPLGGLLLWLLAAGLLCFAGWRFLQSFFDSDRYGRSLYGMMRRTAFAGSGLFYFGLALATVQITIEERRMTEDHAARDWTQWLMAQPLGRALTWLIAMTFVAVAIGLVVKMLRAPYRHHLDPDKLARAWAISLASFGLLTRAVVFLMIGAFLSFAAYDSNSTEVVGLSGALRILQQQVYGGWLLGIAALGLLAFGCFEMIEAAARRVRVPKL